MRCSVNARQYGADTGVGSGSGGVSGMSVASQHERHLFTHDAAGAGDERDIAVGDLGGGAATHHPACGVDDMMHAAGHPGLSESELTAAVSGKSPRYVRSWSLIHAAPCPLG